METELPTHRVRRSGSRLRENHSGMETMSVTPAIDFNFSLRENHSGMETVQAYNVSRLWAVGCVRTIVVWKLFSAPTFPAASDLVA